MKKAALFILFFVAFFAVVHLFGWIDFQDLFRYDIQFVEIGILVYMGAYVSAVLTRLVTRRNHLDDGIETEEKFFGHFFGKVLLLHPIFILLPVFIGLLIWPSPYFFSIGSIVLSLAFGFSKTFGPLPALVVLIVASYAIAHAFYLTWFRNRNIGKPWWKTVLKIIKVIAIIILLRFIAVGVYEFGQNRLYAATIPYKDGETITVNGSIGCGKRKPDRPGVFDEMLNPCQRDYLNIFDDSLPGKYARLMLTYEGKHWTTIDDMNGITISGVFKKRPGHDNNIWGEVKLISAKSSGGIDLLAISEIEKVLSSEVNGQPVWDPTINDFKIPQGLAKHGKSYDFREYYIARYEPEPWLEKWQQSGNYQTVQNMDSGTQLFVNQDIEPSVITIRHADGSADISINDPSDKWTPEEEQVKRKEATMEFYSGKTVGTQSSVGAPTTQEILQIFIDNPDFSFSAEEQQKRSAYQAANPGASNFGYFSPQKSIPDPNVKKIMYWPGKINQHWDIATQKWISDPDGVSGADIPESQYCFKWYGEGAGVSGHAKETISTWRQAGSMELFTATRVSMQCL